MGASLVAGGESCTLYPTLKVHPVCAVRVSNMLDNRGSVHDNRSPRYAIIGPTPYAIIGSLQKCCKYKQNQDRCGSLQARYWSNLVTIRPPCGGMWRPCGQTWVKSGPNQAARWPDMGSTLGGDLPLTPVHAPHHAPHHAPWCWKARGDPGK